MKPYKKNYAPKNRAEVAGGNDHCWISTAQIWPKDKKQYDKNYRKCFGHD